MPLRLSPELLFPTEATVSLSGEATNDFLTLARRIHLPNNRKEVLEQFKEAFCRSSGDQYYPSSEESWAETDLNSAARSAADNAAGFINAFVEGCDSLAQRGAVVPSHLQINHILEKTHTAFRIENGELVHAANFVAPPKEIENPASAASRAFSEAAGLVKNGQASNAIDRVHTALHGFLLETCTASNICAEGDPTASKLFKLLREQHPAFQPTGPRHEDVSRALRSMATVVDTLSPLRNKASLAHANPLLDEPEAIAAVNSAYTVFRYVQDSIHRHGAI